MVVRGLKPGLPGCPHTDSAGMGEPRALALSMKSLLFGGIRSQGRPRWPLTSQLSPPSPAPGPHRSTCRKSKKCQLRY